MSSPDALLVTQIISAWVETAFWGIHLATYTFALKLILAVPRQLKWIQLIGSTALFAIGTLSVSVSLRQLLDGFVRSTARPEGAVGYYEDFSNPLQAIKSAVLTFQFVIGDLLLIYRCHIVYKRSFVVIALPLLMVLAMLVAGLRALAIINSIGPEPSAAIRTFASVQPWIKAFSALTLANNAILAGLIVWRIWSSHRAVTKFYPQNTGRDRMVHRPYTIALRVVIESGLLYMAFSATTLGLYDSNSNGYFPVLQALVQFVGINFDAIFIRVQQGVAFSGSSNDGRRTDEDVSAMEFHRRTEASRMSGAPQYSTHVKDPRHTTSGTEGQKFSEETV